MSQKHHQNDNEQNSYEHSISILSLDYTIVAQKATCGGEGQKLKGMRKGIDECAAACRGESQMFSYGTNFHGENLCSGDKCTCKCEMDTNNFKCDTQISHDGYYLYKFKGEIFHVSLSTIFESETNVQ